MRHELDLWDILVLVGVALVVFGLWWWWPPAVAIFGGVMVVVGGLGAWLLGGK